MVEQRSAIVFRHPSGNHDSGGHALRRRPGPLLAIHEAEQELTAERNAQRNLLRERNVLFFDEGNWPTTERMERLRQRLHALEDEQAR